MNTDFQSHFDTTGPISLTVELQQGDVSLTAADSPTTEVRLVARGKHGAELAEKFTVEAHGNDVVVIAPKLRDGVFGIGWRASVDVEVSLPAGSTLAVKTGSGDVVATGRLADVRAATGSGDLTFEDLDEGDLRSGSGDIRARAVRGGMKAKTGSGDITLESAGGRVELDSGSGDIRLRRSDGDLRARTGSGDLGIGSSSGDLDLLTGTGDVQLGGVRGGAVRAKTGTGDVSIAVALGVAVYLDLGTVTGDVDIDLEEADGPEGSESQASVSVHSGSGDIRVARANAGD